MRLLSKENATKRYCLTRNPYILTSLRAYEYFRINSPPAPPGPNTVISRSFVADSDKSATHATQNRLFVADSNKSTKHVTQNRPFVADSDKSATYATQNRLFVADSNKSAMYVTQKPSFCCGQQQIRHVCHPKPPVCCGQQQIHQAETVLDEPGPLANTGFLGVFVPIVAEALQHFGARRTRCRARSIHIFCTTRCPSFPRWHCETTTRKSAASWPTCPIFTKLH